MIPAHDLGNIRTKKALIRKEAIAKRNAMSADEVARKSAAICEAFLASYEYKNASTILLYKAVNNEVDTDMIFERALSDGKIVAYPRSKIVDGEPDLSFYVLKDKAKMHPGFKGIPEPDSSCDVMTGPADICITPGTAYDRRCHRLGYGKAFYDRYIRLNNPKKVIGLAYDLQIKDDFETEESDMAVDMVITETAVYKR